MRLKARFPSADGLRAGAEVELAGVHIGKIDKVVLLPPDSPADARVEAILLIDQKLDGNPVNERIRTDSTAQMVSSSLLANDKFINITPGTLKGAPVSENYILGSATATTINDLTETGNELLTELNQLAAPANEILNKANRGEGTLDPPTARTICELAIKLRDIQDVSSIFVTHEMKNLEYLSSEYATVNDEGEVIFELEGEKLCLTNTEIVMLKEGKIIFTGKDEEFFASEDPYIQTFVRGK